MILKKSIATFILSICLVNVVSGLSYSNVYVESETFPVRYYQYGGPYSYTSVGSHQIPEINSVHTSVPAFVTPCVSPCIFPGQAMAAINPSPGVLQLDVQPYATGPVVVAPAAKEDTTGYEYSYVVYDDSTGDHKAQRELSDGSVVRGEYSFLQPDGYVREVQYEADDVKGFNAVVKTFLPVALSGKSKGSSVLCHDSKQDSLKEASPESIESVEHHGHSHEPAHTHSREHNHVPHRVHVPDTHAHSHEAGHTSEHNQGQDQTHISEHDNDNAKGHDLAHSNHSEHHGHEQHNHDQHSDEQRNHDQPNHEQRSHEQHGRKLDHGHEDAQAHDHIIDSKQHSKENLKIVDSYESKSSHEESKGKNGKMSKEESKEESEETSEGHSAAKDNKKSKGKSKEQSIEESHGKPKEKNGKKSEEEGSSESEETSKESHKKKLKTHYEEDSSEEPHHHKKPKKGFREILGNQEKQRKQSKKQSSEESDEESSERMHYYPSIHGKHSDSHELVVPQGATGHDVLVPYNDIIRCVQSALKRASGHRTPLREEPSPLTYIVLNKPC